MCGSKWLAAEQWADVTKSRFHAERKEEELDEKPLNYVLGRDERLKRVMGIHSNENMSGVFCQWKFINKKRIFLCHCATPGNTPTSKCALNKNNINARKVKLFMIIS